MGWSHEKAAQNWAANSDSMCCVLALAGFETAVCLIDDIDAALATHDPAITVPVLERAERVLDLHGVSPVPCGAGQRLVLRVPRTGARAGPEQ